MTASDEEDIAPHFEDVPQLENYKMEIDDLVQKIEKYNGHYTPKIEREVAKMYVKNPKDVNKLIERYNIKGYANFILPKCRNLAYNSNDVVVYQDPDTNEYWCYDKEDWSKKRIEYNPYNLKNVIREFSSEHVNNSSVILSKDAYFNLKFWTELTYTLGKIYYNVSENIAQEFAKTLQKDKIYHLYRGMSFKTEDDYAKFLSKYKCSEGGTSVCVMNFDTFSSWTYDTIISENFSTYFYHGIIIEATFTAEELLIDITKVNDKIFKQKLRYHESEVVAIPFKKEVTVYNFDPSLVEEFVIDIPEGAEDVDLVAKGIKSLKGAKFPSSVKKLYLRANELVDISEDEIDNLENLEVLDISSNRFDSMEDLELPKNLIELDISGNKITELNHDYLKLDKSLPKLEKLDISANKITKLKKIKFPETLKYLNISQNGIKEIGNIKFPNLVELDISHNRITTLLDIKFPKSLKILRIYDNEINGSEIRYLPDHIKEIYFDSNRTFVHRGD
jgi:hypothetical protein